MTRPSADPHSGAAGIPLGGVSQSSHCVGFGSKASGAPEAHGQVWCRVADALRRRLPAASLLVPDWLQGGDRPACPRGPAERPLSSRVRPGGVRAGSPALADSRRGAQGPPGRQRLGESGGGDRPRPRAGGLGVCPIPACGAVPGLGAANPSPGLAQARGALAERQGEARQAQGGAGAGPAGGGSATVSGDLPVPWPSLRRCADPAFARLRQALGQWFAPTAGVSRGAS